MLAHIPSFLRTLVVRSYLDLPEEEGESERFASLFRSSALCCSKLARLEDIGLVEGGGTWEGLQMSIELELELRGVCEERGTVLSLETGTS